MPIRLNLLAEAQALEELRRKDPVKRTLIGSILVVGLVLAWSAILQLKIIASSADLKSFQGKWADIESAYKVAVESQRELIQAEKKLAALEQLRTNRFLWGSALNAFQQTLDKVDAIQVVRLRTEQTFKVEEATKARTNGTVVIPGRPAQALEKSSILVEATDSSSQPGSQVNGFKQSILAVPYFQENLQGTNGVLLTSLSPPAVDPTTGNSFVKFTLQCVFPEKVR